MKTIYFLFFLQVLSINSFAEISQPRSIIEKSKKEIELKHKVENTKIKKIIADSDSADSDEFSDNYKDLNYKIFTSLASELLSETSFLAESSAPRTEFANYREILSNLEFREVQVERTFDQVQLHFKTLEEKQFKNSLRVFIDYISWQSETVLTSAANSYDLITTNKGYCPGVNFSKENKSLSFSIEGCIILASGAVNSLDQAALTYSEDHISARGLKTAISVGTFASPLRSEVGLKLPLMYVSQTLTEPAGYKIKSQESFLAFLGLYSRWPVGSYFVQTEFSKNIAEDQVLWALGLGMKF